MLLHKQPKKTNYKGFIKGAILIETIAFIGSYFVWNRLNNSQEFRYWTKQHVPIILESYYQLGEKLGNLQTRDLDEKSWKEKK